MKIIHCADLHLDSRMQTNLTKEQAKERKAEILETFRSMIEYAAENNVSAIMIAGDLFDTKRVSARTVNVVKDEVLSHPSIMFYYLKGNHDVSTFFDEEDDMPDNLKTFSDEWLTYCPGTEEDCSIRITGAELSAKNSSSLYDSLVLDTACINIIMMHGQESENRSDKTECINLRALKNKGIDYLALGHIHSHKEKRLDARGIYCYPGCLEGRGFDECGEHGFVLLDIDEEKKTVSTEYIPLAFRKFMCIETDISGCMTTPQIKDRISKKLSDEKNKGTYEETDLLKIVLTGSLDVECEKDIDYLSKTLEGQCWFLKIDDKSDFKFDPASYKHDESLKGEFVRTVMADETISDPDKAAIIRYGIQALKGRTD